MERIAIVAITKDGARTAMKLADAFSQQVDVFISDRLSDVCIVEGSEKLKGFSFEIMDEGFLESSERIFRSYTKIVLLMACGIAVRAFGPYANDKTVDPAVVVADERGKHVISLLSGHLGGANELAKAVAAVTGGIPIITTASDLKGFFAVDILAEKAAWHLKNIHEAGKVTAEMVDGEKAGILIEREALMLLPDTLVEEILNGGYTIREVKSEEGLKGLGVLVYVGWKESREFEAFSGAKTWAVPKDLVLGIGCKKDTDQATIELAVKHALAKAHLDMERVHFIATIGLKAQEPGLRDFATREKLKIQIVSEEEVAKVEHLFAASEFVKQAVGISSVAEPCAYLGSGKGTKILERQAENGVTVAIYRKKLEGN